MHPDLVLDQHLLARSTPIGLNEMPGFFAHKIPLGLPLSCIREAHLYGTSTCGPNRLYPIVEHEAQAKLLEKDNLRVASLMASDDATLFMLARKDVTRPGHVLLEVVTDPDMNNVFLLVHC